MCTQDPRGPLQLVENRGSPAARSFGHAEHLYRTGKFDAAVEEYGALLTGGSQPELAYAGLARVYLKQKKPAEAYTAAAKAAKLAPTSSAAHVALGEVYVRQGKIPEAEQEFMALVRAGSQDARAYLGMARVSKAVSSHKQAKRMIDMAYALDSTDPDVRRVWLESLSLQERIKALQEYLAGETNEDAKERGDLERQLVVLQDEASQSTPPCRLFTKTSAMQTDLKQLFYGPGRLRAYGLNVKLNGTPSTLLLDTGADGIIVDRKIAEKAGIRRIVQAGTRGIGDRGEAAGYVGSVDSIRIGDLEFRHCYARVVDKSSIIGVDGLIGTDVFSDFLVDIDFPDAKLKLSELPPRPEQAAAGAAPGSRSLARTQLHDRYVAPEMQSFTPVYRFGHQLLIQTKVNDSAPKLFLIDTRALSNTISPAAAREVTRVSSDPRLQLKGLSGTIKEVFRGNEVMLTFGHLRQKNLDIVAFNTTGISDSIGREVSGMLGFAMLRMLEIKIDYRDGLVDLIFDPQRWR